MISYLIFLWLYHLYIFNYAGDPRCEIFFQAQLLDTPCSVYSGGLLFRGKFVDICPLAFVFLPPWDWRFPIHHNFDYFIYRYFHTKDLDFIYAQV